MSGKGHAKASKQRTINNFFKSSPVKAHDTTAHPVQETLGLSRADDGDEGQHRTKKRRISEAKCIKPADGCGVTEATGRSKQAPSLPHSPTPFHKNTETVIDLLEASTSTQGGMEQLEVERSDAAGGHVHVAIGAAPTPTRVELKPEGSNGLRRLMAARRCSSAATPVTAPAVSVSCPPARTSRPTLTPEALKHTSRENPPQAFTTPSLSGLETQYTENRAAAAGAEGGFVRQAMTPQLRERARHKLAQEYGKRMGLEPDATASLGGGGPAPKLTPLEQQVVELRVQHPGTLLMVEVSTGRGVAYVS